MSETATGSCLCGGVRYHIIGPLRDVLQCHCVRCRKITGNFMAASAAPADALVLDTHDTLTWYHPDDDPNVSYGFCGRCGSTLFWKVVGRAQHADTSICAGTLDEAPELRTAAIWFADQAAAHTTLDPAAEHINSADL